MPYWYAKVRRQLKHIQSINIESASDGGAFMYMLTETDRGASVPSSRTWFESIDAAKMDAEQQFKIQPADWSFDGSKPSYLAIVENTLANALTAYTKAISKQRPTDPLIAAAAERKVTSADTKRMKRQLPGVWKWNNHALTIDKDGTWSLQVPSEVGMSWIVPTAPLHGKWFCGSGRLRMSQWGGNNVTMVLVEVGEEALVVADYPSTIRFVRQNESVT